MNVVVRVPAGEVLRMTNRSGVRVDKRAILAGRASFGNRLNGHVVSLTYQANELCPSIAVMRGRGRSARPLCYDLNKGDLIPVCIRVT